MDVSIDDTSHLGETVTIYGENMGHTGSTTFTFNDHLDPHVTIANMKVEIPGNTRFPALICADVLGLETVEPDAYMDPDDASSEGIYYVDWSAAPEWVEPEKEQTETNVKGHVCNRYKLKDPDMLYEKAIASISFRDMSSASLYFWFWNKDILFGEWVDDNKKHYYQVSVDPNAWMENSDKDSVCKSAGYSSAIGADQDMKKLTQIAPAYWFDSYQESFTHNFWSFEKKCT